MAQPRASAQLCLLLAALVPLLSAVPVAAQLPRPQSQPPLLPAGQQCPASSELCGSLDGEHRCCSGDTKCGAFTDGKPRCATCIKACTMAWDCQAGFKCGLVGGCATCVADTSSNGQGGFVRPTPKVDAAAGPAAAATMVAKPTAVPQQKPAAVPQAVPQQKPAAVPQAVPRQKPAAVPQAVPRQKPAAAASGSPGGCNPACGQGRRCVRIAPSSAAARLGARPTWRCVAAPRPSRRMLETAR